MKVYKTGRRFDRRGTGRTFRTRRLVLLGLLLPALLLLLYLFAPIGTQRAVLLGSDARADEASRSDTILIAAAGGQSGMLSVPRDTLVEIPGVGEDKVNAAFASGGPELTVQTLEELADARIGNYVVVSFGGVEDVVNALGGITVDVEQPIDLGIEGRVFHIDPGRQTLNGGEALAYVRYRGGPTADIGRVGRQQEFLRVLGAQVLSPGKLPRLPAVVVAAWRNTDTNMNPLEAARFAIQYKLWGGDAPVEIYPGTPRYINGISYWVPDKQAGERVVEETIR